MKSSIFRQKNQKLKVNFCIFKILNKLLYGYIKEVDINFKITTENYIVSHSK